MSVTVEEIQNVLKQINDPEIHLSIVDLGLVYGVEVKPLEAGHARADIRVTLTSPACPYGPQLLSKIHSDVASLPGISEVNLDLVWIPPWDPRTMATDEVKMQMGIFDLDAEDGDGKAEK